MKNSLENKNYGRSIPHIRKLSYRKLKEFVNILAEKDYEKNLYVTEKIDGMFFGISVNEYGDCFYHTKHSKYDAMKSFYSSFYQEESDKLRDMFVKTGLYSELSRQKKEIIITGEALLNHQYNVIEYPRELVGNGILIVYNASGIDLNNALDIMSDKLKKCLKGVLNNPIVRLELREDDQKLILEKFNKTFPESVDKFLLSSKAKRNVADNTNSGYAFLLEGYSEWLEKFLYKKLKSVFVTNGEPEGYVFHLDNHGLMYKTTSDKFKKESKREWFMIDSLRNMNCKFEKEYKDLKQCDKLIALEKHKNNVIDLFYETATSKRATTISKIIKTNKAFNETFKLIEKRENELK